MQTYKHARIFFVVQPGSWCKEGRIEKEVYISLLPHYPYFFVQLGSLAIKYLVLFLTYHSVHNSHLMWIITTHGQLYYNFIPKSCTYMYVQYRTRQREKINTNFHIAGSKTLKRIGLIKFWQQILLKCMSVICFWSYIFTTFVVHTHIWKGHVHCTRSMIIYHVSSSDDCCKALLRNPDVAWSGCDWNKAQMCDELRKGYLEGFVLLQGKHVNQFFMFHLLSL